MNLWHICRTIIEETKMKKGRKALGLFLTVTGIMICAGLFFVGRQANLNRKGTANANKVVAASNSVTVGQVSNLKTKTASKSIVILSWDELSSADGYKVYRNENKKSFVLVSKTTETSRRLKIKPDVEYQYKVVPYAETEEGIIEGKAAVCKYSCKRITLSAAGDCTLGVDSRYNSRFNEMYQRQTPEYFLKKVKRVFEKDDVTIVNFEGTLTNSNSRADKTFTFKGKKKYTKILTSSSVEVVNMANNHTLDFGTRGLRDTKKALKDAKIKYCMDTTVAYKKIDGVKMAFLGFNRLNSVSKETIKKTIKEARDNGAKIIVVSFHWGIERVYYPTADQKEFAHYAISQGANLVLGHHPHVLQGVERYKKSYIVYSLGNFCFGGNSNPSDKDTMIFGQEFYVDSNGKFIANANGRIIPCSLSSHSNTNDFQPKILKGTKKQSLIKKMRRLSKNMGLKIRSDGTLK